MGTNEIPYVRTYTALVGIFPGSDTALDDLPRASMIIPELRGTLATLSMLTYYLACE